MTNEEYIKAIELRRSRRTYTAKGLDADTIEVVKNLIDVVNEKAGLNFQLIENGTRPFTIVTGKFSYIAVCGPDTEKARIQSGYWGEMIVLQCVYHGLGTCWITGSYDENKVYEDASIPKDQRLYGVIVIGRVKDKLSTKEKLIYNTTHKQNKPYQKMFDVCDEKLPPYYEYAMKLVEKAPSATNRRPVHFKYENGVISASVDAPYSDKSLDFGIAQLHFQLGAAAKGLKGQWDFSGRFCTEDGKVIKFPESENKENTSQEGDENE
ncbi:MAG: nitroreductase family protein [Eubacteriales bacterium]|nr:nitroreductase family protein [Eubacteriales bacterium]